MMKKILLVFLILFSVMSFVFSQNQGAETGTSTSNIVDKHGRTILPKAGDIAIGLDMIPFFNYLGNFANNTVGNTYDPSFLSNNNTFLLKYFLEDETAVRLIFRASVLNNKIERYVRDDAAVFADPLSNAVIADVMQISNSDYVLGVGYEKRRGRSRLRGIYGADVYILFCSEKEKYTYGNNYTTVNTEPTAFHFGTNIIGNDRIISRNRGNDFGLGANVFLGVEYFFMTNICLGTEVSWGGNFIKGTQESHVKEYWNNSSAIEQTILDSPGNREINFDIHNPSIGIYLMFHF